MAEKHESEPIVQKNSEFRKRVEVGSASSWSAFNIDLFGVLNEKNTYEELPLTVYEHCLMDEILLKRNAHGLHF